MKETLPQDEVYIPKKVHKQPYKLDSIVISLQFYIFQASKAIHHFIVPK